MKSRMRILQVGQMIWGTIEEIQSDHGILVSFQGDLLRVQNQTSSQFHQGQRVRLEVVSTLPLEFRHRPVERSPSRYLDLEI